MPDNPIQTTKLDKAQYRTVSAKIRRIQTTIQKHKVKIDLEYAASKAAMAEHNITFPLWCQLYNSFVLDDGNTTYEPNFDVDDIKNMEKAEDEAWLDFEASFEVEMLQEYLLYMGEEMTKAVDRFHDHAKKYVELASYGVKLIKYLENVNTALRTSQDKHKFAK